MDNAQLNKILFRLNQWSGYILIIIMVLYFVSGYGMAKAIIDPVFSKSLHENWLPIPTVILIILHTWLPIKRFLIKRIKDEEWINVYLLLVSLIVFLAFFYLYLL